MGQIRPEDRQGDPPEASLPASTAFRSAPEGTGLFLPGSRSAGRTWAAKFAHACRGVARAIRSESSFRIHLPVAASVIAAGAIFRIDAVEWAVAVLAIGGVLTAELLNSAIEQVVRGPGSRRHPRLRDALDIASGGVLVAAAAAVIAGLSIFLPRLLALL